LRLFVEILIHFYSQITKHKKICKAPSAPITFYPVCNFTVNEGFLLNQPFYEFPARLKEGIGVKDGNFRRQSGTGLGIVDNT